MGAGVAVSVQVAVAVGAAVSVISMVVVAVGASVAVSAVATVIVAVSVGVAVGDVVGPGVGPMCVNSTAVAVPWSQVTSAVFTTVRPPQVLYVLRSKNTHWRVRGSTVPRTHV